MVQALSDKESALTAIKIYIDILDLAQRADVQFSTRQICTAFRWATAVELLSANYEVLADALRSIEITMCTAVRLGFDEQVTFPLLLATSCRIVS